jgi:ubiquinone/menaquinone biosynthesis C-methylase UbiE
MARFLRSFLRFFFHHFYHEFAWMYDSVAAVVSLGRWNDWTKIVLPYIKGSRVLEIGHGPGGLHRYLVQESGRIVVGLDESAQMGRITKRRLSKAGYLDHHLTRGLAQALPFSSATFDTVVSTFPAEYIFAADTMANVMRVLRSGGRFIVLPTAWIIGRKLLDRIAAWLFRITQQAPDSPLDIISAHMRRPFEEAGFKVDVETVELRSSLALIVIAWKE